MLKTLKHVFLTLAIVGLGAAHLSAAPDETKWSKVDNNSGINYDVYNADLADFTSWGTLYIKEEGSTEAPVKITVGESHYTLVNKHHYLFYFDTTLKKFAKHLAFVPVKSPNAIPIYVHITNVTKQLKGFHIDVYANKFDPKGIMNSSKKLYQANIIIDPTGFRNIKGGVLFTLRHPVMSPDGKKTTDDNEEVGSDD